MITKPEYQPTEADRNTVNAMAACGFSHEAIARCLGDDGIDPKTLRKHFRQELDTAALKANTRIGQVAFAKAAAGEPWAVCFWMKCRARWKETSGVELTGKDGSPIEVSHSAALASRITRIAARIDAGGTVGELE